MATPPSAGLEASADRPDLPGTPGPTLDGTATPLASPAGSIAVGEPATSKTPDPSSQPAAPAGEAADTLLLPSVAALSTSTPSGELRPPLPAGTLLNGRYHVVRVLRGGAFGRVYLAEDTQETSKTLVAIKEIPDTQFASPEDKQEAIIWFKHEVSSLLTLNHPAIPAIHGHWTASRTAGPYFLVMDYIPGKTLDKVLKEAGGRLPWQQVVAWGVALCDVLAYLHDRKPPFVFRDLRLHNILLNTQTNMPVLLDFGIARQLAPMGDLAVGTWGYMPPEQVLGRAEPRSDLYALGATLHALLTGRNPEMEFIRLQRNGVDTTNAMRMLFPAADSLVPEVPTILGQVLTKATSFAALDRFADARTMSAALRRALGPVSVEEALRTAVIAKTGTQPVTDGRPEPSQGKAPAPPPIPAAKPAPAATPSAAPAKPAAPARPTLIVGPGEFPTIVAALGHAPVGARIEVQPGRYTETLVLDSVVEIIGVGSAEEIVLEVNEAPCVVMLADKARLCNLTVRCRSTGEHYAVDIPKGRLLIEDCRITSNSRTCVAIHGETAVGMLRRCRLHDASREAIELDDGGQGLVEESILSGNWLGVSVKRSKLLMRRCSVRDSKMWGVQTEDQGVVMLEDCNVFASGKDGVVVGGRSELRRCQIYNAKGNGILASDTATLAECEVHSNGLAGVVVTGKPVLEKCHIHTNGQSGVEIKEDGTPQIRECRINGNAGSAISISSKGGGVVERSDLTQNARGPWSTNPRALYKLQRVENQE